MRILHTADWHLGKRLGEFSRIEEQKAVLNEICEIADAQKVDAVLIAGDLFDVLNPTVESIEIYFKTLKRLANEGKRPVIAIAGNHDSPERIETPEPLARECGIIFSGFPDSKISPFELPTGVKILNSDAGFISLKLPAYDYPLNLLLTPYANEVRMKSYLGVENEEQELRNILSGSWKALADKYCQDDSVNIMVAHLYMVSKGAEKPEEPDGEKSILHIGGAGEVYFEAVPAQVQYVALGHLHRFQNIGTKEKPAIYSSSPLQYSFSEAGQEKHVVILEAEPGKPVAYKKVKLTKGRGLFRKKFDSFEMAGQWLNENQDTLVEITLVADDFIDPAHLRALHKMHDGIIQIIPEIRNMKSTEGGAVQIDLQKSTEQLFVDYYKHSKQQNPSEEIIELFREILNE